MAAYTGIQGQNILIVSSDPANPVEGQIWYNSTTNLLKGQKYVEAWASGGNVNTARFVLLNGIGTQTAGLIAGGYIAPTNQSATESYNGTSWTTSPGSLNTARRDSGGAGTQTAGLIFGGFITANSAATESWGGTSWTTVNSLNTARRVRGSGLQTAALAFGGESTGITTATESWNGTSWTTVNSLNTARYHGGASGIQSSSLYFGGNPGTGTSAATESWNGTSWTTVNSMNTARGQAGAGSGSSNSSALAFSDASVTTESYTGTWTTTANSSITRGVGGGLGTQTASLSISGENPGGSLLSSTEEWNAGPVTQTITTS